MYFLYYCASSLVFNLEPKLWILAISAFIYIIGECMSQVWAKTG